MQHTLSLNQLQATFSAQAEGMMQAIETCVHCGFCLPTCPTYQITGQEMDSPRGRIVLMKTALEKDIQSNDALPYLDRCLGCLACVSVCPSGVRYHELLVPYRSHARKSAKYTLAQKISQQLARATLPHPRRFRAAARLGAAARPLARLMPGEFRSMLDLLPNTLPANQKIPAFTPARGPLRARVALLEGCSQQVLAPEINQATLEVLSHNGVEVHVPPGQVCCGALLLHSGDLEGARKLARQNLSAFAEVIVPPAKEGPGFAALITNAAGCGSGLKDYAHLFLGMPEHAQAEAIGLKTQDITVFLAGLGLLAPPALPQKLRVAYHDACHLCHAQGVSDPPRQLLSAIPNLELVPLPQSDFCCGSAGTYNIEQPELALQLGQKKARFILESGCELVVAGNIGCIIQIRKHLSQAQANIPVLHTIQLLALAYRQTPVPVTP